MPANTARGFPYPLPTEPVAEGAQAIRNLAEAVDAKGLTLIQSLLLSANGDIAFTAIPQTFTHLVLLASLRATVPGSGSHDDAMLRLNGNTAGVYTSQWTWADGTAVAAAEAINAPWAPVGFIPDSTVGGSAVGTLRLDLPDYRASGSFKNWRASSYAPGANTVAAHGGVFAVAGAITRIDLLGAGGSLAAGSRASLYGLP